MHFFEVEGGDAGLDASLGHDHGDAAGDVWGGVVRAWGLGVRC
jgi:hypothetical protein